MMLLLTAEPTTTLYYNNTGNNNKISSQSHESTCDARLARGALLPGLQASEVKRNPIITVVIARLCCSWLLPSARIFFFFVRSYGVRCGQHSSDVSNFTH
uniref:Uncharacterized protein n=1 Tax=Sipha flava TaxID=143950 RepID=A0A2S2QC74_9HEMI